MNRISRLLSFSLFLGALSARAQDRYQYSVDLNAATDDRFHVSLLTPKVKGATALFSFPKIIPGTYSISDYGKFVSDVRAFDRAGKALPVSRVNDNQWKISGAASLHRLTYTVDDIFDATQQHDVYPMAATNIEDKKNYVVHTPGVFGFFEGAGKLPFELQFEKPSGFYAATSLKPVASTDTRDVFRVAHVDELYDAPILFSLPDTTTIRVGNADVLVAVYSPKKGIRSAQIAEWMGDLLEATRKYLGGRLPADKYAFLYYFKDPQLKHSFPAGLMGALEHATSSFYYLPDAPAEALRSSIVDISSHEFFHIITPLTIASREVKEFNFSRPVLSRHLWLYEGVTEYTSHHVQVKYGLNSVREFLDKLSEKITSSRTAHNDTLPFTVMSRESAGKYKDEYGNVYQKGALIAACLDVYLLHLSKGVYGLRNLTYDLGVRYGKDRPFEDEALFAEIGKLTYPEVEAFLEKYVGGNTPIPYEQFFSLAGVSFTPKMERKVFSFGGIYPVVGRNGVITVGPNSQLNAFGQKLGYKVGDELYAFNGVPVRQANLGSVIDSIKREMKEGMPFTVKIGRAGGSGAMDTLTLRANVEPVTETAINRLEVMPEATALQKAVRRAWLTAPKGEPVETPAAAPADVASVDAIIKALYGVISGPAGPRDWNRFHSLFLPDAQMGAVITLPNGTSEFRPMTPATYRQVNAPFFAQSPFYEEELGRTVLQFGNMATVQSAYQFRLAPDGPAEQRGVNYYTLVKSAGRWWVANITWQEETKDNPIPASLLKK